jgi:hypothetical protein
VLSLPVSFIVDSKLNLNGEGTLEQREVQQNCGHINSFSSSKK